MRTPPADLRLYYLHRPAPTLGDVRLQTYFPSLEVLFPSLTTAVPVNGSPCLAAKELVVSVSGDTAIVEDLQTKRQRTAPIWTRQIHLVEPLDFLEGEYVLPRDGALPAPRAPWQRALRKLNDPYNEAYTDAVFACMASRLVETGRSPHFCRFFGTFNGRVPEYRYNISEDMPDIEGEPWFRQGLQKGEFRVYAVDPYDPENVLELKQPTGLTGLRSRRLTAELDELSVSLDSSEPNSDSESDSDSDSAHDKVSTSSATGADQMTDLVEADLVEADLVEADLVEADIEVSGTAVVDRPTIRLSRIGSPSQGSRDSDSTESDDIDYRLVVRDFPVQATILERCDGTLDDLMEDEIDEDVSDDMRETKEQRWTAWIFQVIAGLAVAQQAYDFVHNDLHTNNVVWSGTGETHLYYHVVGAAGGDRYYRVPTYGRILKIIDFGRATFRPSALATQNRLWIPDAYAPGADAAGQYNCGPYFEHGKPKVVPNRSFDLCRLAVAMLETLWPEPPAVPSRHRRVLTKEPGRVQHETESPLWNLLWLWLTDRHGKNMLRAPDGRERYPHFNLYCAIARDVQNAVPAQQITLPLFDQAFRCRRKDIPAEAHIWKLPVSQH